MSISPSSVDNNTHPFFWRLFRCPQHSFGIKFYQECQRSLCDDESYIFCTTAKNTKKFLSDRLTVAALGIQLEQAFKTFV
jgi:hypothetical protein